MKDSTEIVAIKNNRSRIYISTAIFFLVIVSWFNFLDKVSTVYVDGAIVQGTITFGIARAFNGAISVLQSIQVGILGSSVTIGELLDPINDLVEQFSTLMKYSIGSLIIQKILLEIVSDTFFKILVTISGIILFIATYMNCAKHFNFATKIFIFMLFLRYIIVLSIAMNAVVDKAFIEEKFEKNIQVLKSYTADVDSIRSITSNVKGGMTAFRAKISQLIDTMGEAVPVILNIMALYIFRVIILPLVFLWFFMRGFKVIWKVDLQKL